MVIRKVKPELRIIGWDDASFKRDQEDRVPIVGSVVRGGKPYLDGVLVEEIEKDGYDATETIAEAVNRSKHKDQLRVIMLDGVTFAGFNTVDIEELNERTGLPVIVVVRKETDFAKFRKAMEKLPNFDKRWSCIEKAGEMKPVEIGDGKEVFFQHTGIDENKARRVVKTSVSRSLLPEPIRISHLIATAIARGESIGRA
ncbi:MAG: DUF99 family protein [Candidatus Aenigmatarchaeota archaeon]